MIVLNTGEYRHHLCDHCGAVGRGTASHYPEMSPALPGGWVNHAYRAGLTVARGHLCSGCAPKAQTWEDMQRRRKASRG